MSSRIAVLAASSILAAAAAPAPRKPASRREATSWAESRAEKDGRRVTRTVNRRFTYARAWRDRTTPVDLLLAETFDRRLDAGAEGERSTVSVDAFPASGEGKGLWSFRTEGSTGEARDDDLYRVTRPGCCGARDLSIYFGLLDGKERFTSDVPVVAIEVPNSPLRRFVAYHDLAAAAPVPGGEKDRHVIGALSWGSERARARRVLVLSDAPYPNEELAAKKLSLVADGREIGEDRWDLWKADRSADAARIGGFSIRVRAFREPDLLFEVPVEGDRLTIGKATLGKGIRLEEAE